MNTMITPLIPAAKLPALDPEKAKKAEEVKAVLRDALDTLKNSKPDYKAQRKAQAAERIARIKEQMKTLRQVAGMDAKAVARIAAQLAKELAAAIKDYKNAGGTDNSVATAAAVPAASSEAKAPEANTEEVSTETVPAPVADKAAQSYEKAASVMPGDDSDKQMDRAFMKDAKGILEELKGWVKIQRARLKKPGMADNINNDMKDVKAAERALADAEKDLQKIAFSSAA